MTYFPLQKEVIYLASSAIVGSIGSGTLHTCITSITKQSNPSAKINVFLNGAPMGALLGFFGGWNGIMLKSNTNTLQVASKALSTIDNYTGLALSTTADYTSQVLHGKTDNLISTTMRGVTIGVIALSLPSFKQSFDHREDFSLYKALESLIIHAAMGLTMGGLYGFLSGLSEMATGSFGYDTQECQNTSSVIENKIQSYRECSASKIELILAGHMENATALNCDGIFQSQQDS